jgi:hypothetical protein
MVFRRATRSNKPDWPAVRGGGSQQSKADSEEEDRRLPKGKATTDEGIVR